MEDAEGLHFLNYLDLSHNAIDEHSIQLLDTWTTQSTCPKHLHTLRLGSNPIGVEGIYLLINILPYLTSLRTLDLSDIQMTDSAWIRFISLAAESLSLLMILDLSDNLIKDKQTVRFILETLAKKKNFMRLILRNLSDSLQTMITNWKDTYRPTFMIKLE